MCKILEPSLRPPPMTHHFPPTAQSHLILPNALLLCFYPTMKLTAAAILSLAGFASAETFFKEQFDDVSVVSSIHFLWSTITNQVVRHFSIRLVRESRLHVGNHLVAVPRTNDKPPVNRFTRRTELAPAWWPVAGLTGNRIPPINRMPTWPEPVQVIGGRICAGSDANEARRTNRLAVPPLGVFQGLHKPRSYRPNAIHPASKSPFVGMGIYFHIRKTIQTTSHS